MLELRGLRKRLGALALEDVDLRLDAGEYFVLLGPSGVGKTVLLEMVAGLIAPDAGQVLADGVDLTTTPPERRGFSLVCQEYALFPHLTVAENIAYGLRTRGVPARERTAQVGEVARRLGIEALLRRTPEGLSGGEQQRVALARALVTAPAVLLLDEPLAALDRPLRLRLRRELKRVQRESGRTFLHVTHDPEEAFFLGDRVGIMLHGRLQWTGPPDELLRRPADWEVAEFLEMRNVVSVTCAEGVCRTGGLEIHAAAADENTTHLWIRPEEILLSREPFSSSARNQFAGRVVDWELSGGLLAVRVAVGALHLIALITAHSFSEQELAEGTEVYCTFKSSALHCF
jgi:molybdate/tungstate transport system ATP-binding protein